MGLAMPTICCRMVLCTRTRIYSCQALGSTVLEVGQMRVPVRGLLPLCHEIKADSYSCQQCAGSKSGRPGERGLLHEKPVRKGFCTLAMTLHDRKDGKMMFCSHRCYSCALEQRASVEKSSEIRDPFSGRAKNGGSRQ